MTIICAAVRDGEVVIAGDSQGSAGWDKVQRDDPKVFSTHGILYGFTSSYRMGQILRYHSEEVLSSIRSTDTHGYVVTSLIPMWRRVLSSNGFSLKDEGADKGGNFIIGIDGKIFVVESDFQVGITSIPYWAVGCGYAYALGAMYSCITDEFEPEYLVRRGVEAAKEFSNGCGGRVDVVRSTHLR